MNIAINCRVLNERQGGPFRYTHNLIRELAALDRKNRYFLIFNTKIYEFDFPIPDNFQCVYLRPANKLIFDYISLPLYTWRIKFDIILFPKNTFSPLVRGNKIPFFNDIVYFEKLGFREFKFFDNLHHTIMVPVAGRLSRVNFSISDFTASRMMALLHIPRERIRVIKLGIEKKFIKIEETKKLDTVIKKYGIQKPFFFYSGSLSPRKNMTNIIKAFVAIRDRVPHNIYVTGGYSWRDSDIFSLLKENGIEDRVVKLGFLSDDELIAMYSMADAYLYPSLYEGFGLPILEAQACGCPVITSTAASCPEVAGDAAILVDPYDVSDIARAMLEVVQNRSHRSRIVKAGYKNAAKYSWKKTAMEFMEVFKEISGDTNRG